MPLEFDPNNPAKQKNRPVWATYIPKRKGSKFKQHTDRGKALNAFQYAYGILYHWEPVINDEGVAEPQWVEVSRREKSSENCERCGVKFKSGKYPPPPDDGTEYHHGVWIGRPTLRKVDVCGDCESDILHPRFDTPQPPYFKGGKPRIWKTSTVRKVDDREL